MKAKKSVMQLETVRVDNFRLEWSLSTLEDKFDPGDYTVNLDFNIAPLDESEQLYGIKLLLKVNERKTSTPFRAKTELYGTFRFTSEEISEERKARYLLLNGLSILYSFARGYFFAKLDSLPPDSRLLPTVNLLDLVEKKAAPKRENT